MSILIILDIRTLRIPLITQSSVTSTGCVRLTWVRNSHLLCAMLGKNVKLCFQILQILVDIRIERFKARSSNPKFKSSVHFIDSACSRHFFARKISSIPASLFVIFPRLPHLCFWSLSNFFSVYTVSISIVFAMHCLCSCLSGPSLISPDSPLPFPVIYIQPQKNVWYIKEFSFSLWFSLSSPVVLRVLFPLSLDFVECLLLLPTSLVSSIPEKCTFGPNGVCRDCFCILVTWTTIRRKRLPLSKTQLHPDRDNNTPEIPLQEQIVRTAVHNVL